MNLTLGEFQGFLVGDDLPAPEGRVIAVIAIDTHPRLDIALIAFLGRRGQRGLQGLKDNILIDAFFIGYRFHH